jgi:hypothetical protein
MSKLVNSQLVNVSGTLTSATTTTMSSSPNCVNFNPTKAIVKSVSFYDENTSRTKGGLYIMKSNLTGSTIYSFSTTSVSVDSNGDQKEDLFIMSHNSTPNLEIMMKSPLQQTVDFTFTKSDGTNTVEGTFAVTIEFQLHQ